MKQNKGDPTVVVFYSHKHLYGGIKTVIGWGEGWGGGGEGEGGGHIRKSLTNNGEPQRSSWELRQKNFLPVREG